jgi:hypothetical protein
VIVLGTFIALVPSLSPATATVRVPAAPAAMTEVALKGGH